MLTIIDTSGEEGVLKRLRSTEAYVQGKFEDEYQYHLSKANSIVQSAKIYILDNYEKVKDWAELNLTIQRSGARIDFYGMKAAERERRYPKKESETLLERKDKARVFKSESIDKILKDLDEITIQIEKIHDVAYDWTDGDFSIKINGKLYIMIDRTNPGVVIEIASFIKKQLNGE